MATTDLLTLAEARSAINISGTGQDDELQLYLSLVSRRIDALCGPVVSRAVTENHDGGGNHIIPRLAPVLSITSLTEYSGTTGTALSAESVSSQPASAYLLDTSMRMFHRIWRRSSGSDATFPTGRQNVVLVYNAGRVASTATVTTDFKGACAAILRRLWKREQSGWAQSPGYAVDEGGAERFYKAVDPMVMELLGHELLPPGVA